MLKQIIALLICIFLNSALAAQCPDKIIIWNRIVYLRDSSKISDSAQLRELVFYQEKFKECNLSTDSTYTLLVLRIGWLISRNKDFESAIARTIYGIDLIRSHKSEPGIDESQLVKAYNNLSIFYDSTGQKSMHKRSSDSCISISLRLKKNYNIASLHISNKIEYLFAKGDYYHCLELASIGEEFSKMSETRSGEALYYDCWEVNSLIFLNRYSEASTKIEKSIIDCLHSGNRTYLGSLLGLKATVAEKLGLVQDAVQYALQSFYYEKKARNYTNCASALSNLAQDLYLNKLHDNEKALYYFRESLRYANTGDSLYILNNIANVYVQKNDFNQAFDFFQQAFDKIYPKADEAFLLINASSDILNSWKVEYLITLVLDKAEAYIKRFREANNLADLRSALAIYKSADRFMNKIKISQTELSSQLFWRSDNRRLYERAIESCYLSENMEDAFYFFEKSRAVLLNDQLKEQQTGDSSMQETAFLKKKILGMENQMAVLNPSSKEYTDIQRTVFANKELLNQVEQQIKERNPWYYQSLIDTNFVNLQSVKHKLLGNNGAQAILEFFNGDSTVYLLTVTADKSKISRISKKEFENKVDKYTTYLSNQPMENQDFTGFLSTGLQLNHLIFKESDLPEGRIIISPDGKYFPLEALVINDNVSAPEYFLNNHIVSYTYSIRFLLNDFTINRISSSGNFLGMAPVQYPATFNLASLAQSDVSLEKISSYFENAKTLVTAAASKNNFMQQFYGYKIIQLYTHASDSSSNGEPIIYFADSILSLSELISENKTATQLIVLSACETGNGKLYKGEGVFSFNRGFAALGIPSSVINLWSVENESTYKITELFYKYTAKGLPLDIALQKAKLDFIAGSSKEKKLPFYWAAAILAGKTDPVILTAGFNWKWVAMAGGVLLVFLAFILIKRKK